MTEQKIEKIIIDKFKALNLEGVQIIGAGSPWTSERSRRPEIGPRAAS